jgi:putative membrane protein
LICSLRKVSVEEFAVAAEDSLKQSMNIAVKRYSSLFRLPSARKVPLLLSIFCVGGGVLSTVILYPTFKGLGTGLLLGLGLLFTSLVADYIISVLVLKGDAVFDLRRTMALSIFCWAVWLFFMCMGAVVGAVTSVPMWWIRLSLLGFSATLILRFTVFNAASSTTQRRLFAASLLQPFLSVVPFLIFWTGIDYPVTVNMLAFFVSSVVIGFAASLSFLFLLNQMGRQTVGLQSVELFRAFMLNWVSNLNAPFEGLLEKLGEEQEIEVSLIKFGSSQTKAVMVVPSVHPGPFKNIGSSLLPAMLKAGLEKEFGCVACVPHGLFGHEYDLASQIQNKRVISEVEACLRGLEVHDENDSPFVTVSNGLATACCQVFGKSAFISFTLAPKTIEDLPQELGRFVREEAEKRGLHLCAVVNAHNSIDGTLEMQESLASLRDVATKCLDKALSLKQSPFEVGVASVLPKEFSLEDGMGSGGITVVVVKSGQQKAAYVVIDGNNMVSGLRERILSSLLSIGIDGGEVFTTDTHAVSALILSEHGYHPVGEAIENAELIRYVKEVTLDALTTSERVGVSCRSITVPNVKVIGAKQLEALCLLIDKAIQRAKRAVLPVFGASGLLLMLLLLFV